MNRTIIMTGLGAMMLVVAIVVHETTAKNQSKPVATTKSSDEAKTNTNSAAPASTTQGSVSINSRSTSTVTVNGKPTTTIAPVNVTITTNDSSASQTSIGVSKGAEVTITFKVSAAGTYHGGLQFKSVNPTLSTGVIKPSGSATLKFTADHSFDLMPYWADGAPKNYAITIKVT